MVSRYLKAICVIAATSILSAPAFSEPVMNLVTVNTKDPAGYIGWAASSSEALSKANGASTMGICVPRGGAEVAGDLYLYSLFDSQKTAWSAEFMNKTMVAEVAKNKADRTIRFWDNYRIVRTSTGTTSATGDKSYQWNVLVSTTNMSKYLASLDKLQLAMRANDFADISVQAFVPDSGDRVGKVMVSMAATSSARLGEALDARTEPWFANTLKGLSNIRTYEHAWALECTTLYNAQP